MNDVPFAERLWCSVAQASQVLGIGKTKTFEKIKAGEIASKKDGARTLIFVPSLIEKHGAQSVQPAKSSGPPSTHTPTNAAVGTDSTPVVKAKK
jgi:hypothetical protein